MIVEGSNGVAIREVELSDAQFILELRTDSDLNRYISQVSGTLEDQIAFLKRCQMKRKDEIEYYFIIEFQGKPTGTVRIYNINQQEQTYTWGSWVVQRNNPGIVALSSAYLTYYFAFNYLHLNKTLIDVRKENISVLKFHKTYATVTGETEQDYLLEFKKDDFWKFTKKFAEKIPTEVKITF